MEDLLGLLKIRVRRGINLIARDSGSGSSDPYVVVTMGTQKLKTKTVKNTCNPEWKDELTVGVSDPKLPVKLTIYDKDTCTSDDKMGEANIDIQSYMECLRMEMEHVPDGKVVSRIHPNRENCLADESQIVWTNGKLLQDMTLRLRDVEKGEVEIQLEWVDIPKEPATEDGSED